LNDEALGVEEGEEGEGRVEEGRRKA